MKTNDAMDIPKGEAHRIKKTGKEKLIFAEAQIGDYFGGDDIMRLEEDFGRTQT